METVASKERDVAGSQAETEPGSGSLGDIISSLLGAQEDTEWNWDDSHTSHGKPHGKSF